MIEEELTRRAQKAKGKPQIAALGSPTGWPGLGDLPHAASRRMMALREPANGDPGKSDTNKTRQEDTKCSVCSG
jgi:hypothetical protein